MDLHRSMVDAVSRECDERICIENHKIHEQPIIKGIVVHVEYCRKVTCIFWNAIKSLEYRL